jgi:thiamine-monophosphate kinase
MKVSSLGEFGLIAAIRRMTVRRPSSVSIGIGDDAAVLRIAPSSVLLVTTDMLLESVHFDLSYTDYFSLGWKSAAVNLSDIAAMGGNPRFCLTSLGIPSSISVEQIKEFYRGFNAVLKPHHVVLVGGDTCSSRKGFVVNVVVLGESDKKRIVTRSGAKPGDRIFVTGTLGDAASGLELLQTRRRNGRQRPWEKMLIENHLRPEPRVEWGMIISGSGCAHAMIDISDGLSSDLKHICDESGVGACIYNEKLPLSRSLRLAAAELEKHTFQYALSGGEDYELLLTASRKCSDKLQTLGIPLTEIGEITKTRKMSFVDGRGRKRMLVPGGYDHFSPSR